MGNEKSSPPRPEPITAITRSPSKQQMDLSSNMNQYTEHLNELCDVDESDRQRGITLLQNICSNILKYPTNPKFLDLNFANMGQRIYQCQPVLLLLFEAGFTLSANGRRLEMELNEPNIKNVRALKRALGVEQRSHFQGDRAEPTVLYLLLFQLVSRTPPTEHTEVLKSANPTEVDRTKCLPLAFCRSHSSLTNNIVVASVQFRV